MSFDTDDDTEEDKGLEVRQEEYRRTYEKTAHSCMEDIGLGIYKDCVPGSIVKRSWTK